MSMNNAGARKVLGLDNSAADLTAEIVQEAFRAQCKRYHPDTTTDVLDNLEKGDLPKVVWTMDALTKARKILLDSLSGDDLACKLCRGTGKVPGKMGLRSCTTCNGTGDKR